MIKVHELVLADRWLKIHEIAEVFKKITWVISWNSRTRGFQLSNPVVTHFYFGSSNWVYLVLTDKATIYLIVSYMVWVYINLKRCVKNYWADVVPITKPDCFGIGNGLAALFAWFLNQHFVALFDWWSIALRNARWLIQADTYKPITETTTECSGSSLSRLYCLVYMFNFGKIEIWTFFTPVFWLSVFLSKLQKLSLFLLTYIHFFHTNNNSIFLTFNKSNKL